MGLSFDKQLMSKSSRLAVTYWCQQCESFYGYFSKLISCGSKMFLHRTIVKRYLLMTRNVMATSRMLTTRGTFMFLRFWYEQRKTTCRNLLSCLLQTFFRFMEIVIFLFRLRGKVVHLKYQLEGTSGRSEVKLFGNVLNLEYVSCWPLEWSSWAQYLSTQYIGLMNKVSVCVESFINVDGHDNDWSCVLPPQSVANPGKAGRL